MQRDLEQRLRAEAVDLWERWAQAHYPDDVGDGGWDESMVDEWLAEVRRGVLERGDVRRRFTAGRAGTVGGHRLE